MEEQKMMDDNQPDNPPNRENPEYKHLDMFCRNVELIIQTTNDNEYYAATTFMKPPDVAYSKAFVFPGPGSVIGMFAGKKMALIRTRQGRECEKDILKFLLLFSNVEYIFGVGVCYGFNSQYKLGDVLVSDQIHEIVNPKFDRGEFLDRKGKKLDVEGHLYQNFCTDLKHKPGLEVSDGRQSKVYTGTILSYSALINWIQLRDQLNSIAKFAIGGEMEGGELLRFVGKGKIKGVIIIKGIADYGDGEKKKDWQFIAARAALHYTESKYEQVLPKRFEEDYNTGKTFSCTYFLD